MNSQDFKQRIAKIQTSIAIHEAEIMANPFPVLNEMSDRCSQVIQALQEVSYALSPAYLVEVWGECDHDRVPRPTDIQGEALIRCTKALKIIHDYESQ